MPTVALEADSLVVRLGDPIGLRLRLQYEEGTSPAPPASPVVAARSRLQPGRVEGPVAEGGVHTLTYHYELRLYEPGVHRVEAPAVAFATGAGDSLWRQASALETEVAGVREAGDEVLRDIKAPLPSTGGIPVWVLATVAAAVAVLGVWLVKWWLDRRAHEDGAPPPVPVNYPAEFSRIAAMGLLERGAYKTYYSLLSEVLRRFLEDRLGMEAMERTTPEIAAGLACLEVVGPDLARRAVAFLEAADLVKFACASPTLVEARAAAEEGKATVQAVDADLARRQAEAPAATPGAGEVAPPPPSEPVAAA